jgi:hypothetical protein
MWALCDHSLIIHQYLSDVWQRFYTRMEVKKICDKLRLELYLLKVHQIQQ